MVLYKPKGFLQKRGSSINIFQSKQNWPAKDPWSYKLWLAILRWKRYIEIINESMKRRMKKSMEVTEVEIYYKHGPMDQMTIKQNKPIYLFNV